MCCAPILFNMSYLKILRYGLFQYVKIFLVLFLINNPIVLIDTGLHTTSTRSSHDQFVVINPELRLEAEARMKMDYMTSHLQNMHNNARLKGMPLAPGITTGIPPSSSGYAIKPGIMSGIPPPVSQAKRHAIPSSTSPHSLANYPYIGYGCSSPPLHMTTCAPSFCSPTHSSSPSSSISSLSSSHHPTPSSPAPGITSGIPPHNNNISNINNNNNSWPKHRERTRKTGLPTVLENNWLVSSPSEAADSTTVGNYNRP